MEHFYDTSFHIHRLTPLHEPNGVPFNDPAILNIHAKSLLSVIRGDVLRGVRVSAWSEESKKDGALEAVEMTNISVGEADDNENGVNGVAVMVKFAKSTYAAYLLRRNVSPESPPSAATARRTTRAATVNPNIYPLLLTRMPSALKATFLNHLQTAFDCKSSALRLSDSLSSRSLEAYLDQYIPRLAEPRDKLPSKSLTISLEPPPITVATSTNNDKELKKLTTLRTVLLDITRQDVIGFLHLGQKLKTKQKSTMGPFELAFSLYLLERSGLIYEKMRLQKVDCGEFTLSVGADGVGRCKFGKIKVPVVDGGAEEESGQTKAPRLLVEILIEATGGS